MISYVTYSRYSDEKQSPHSIEDQNRKCRDFGTREGYHEVRTYEDPKISAGGVDRPAFQRLMADATSKSRDFDLILVDDLSRFSRSQADVMVLHQRLAHHGVRVIAVSQGIDTEHEQSDMLITFHGLKDSLFIKELAKKTHRGLEGRVLKGLSAGGRAYGYDLIPADGGGKRRKINEAEAAILREFFEWRANGYSYKKIAGLLNGRKIPPPQKRADRPHPTWCPSAIREMLRRELYVGRVIWNKTKYVKTPGTNKRIARLRPRNEWHIQEMPDLRIVSEELWNSVQEREERLKKIYAVRGPVSRAASSPYLLSGFLLCGLCGAKLIIVSGQGRLATYGCPQHWNRRACSNHATMKSHQLETFLLQYLQDAVLMPEAIDTLTGKLIKAQDRKEAVVTTDKRAQDLKAQIDRITCAIAETGHSEALLRSLQEREAELRLLSVSKPKEKHLNAKEVRAFVVNSIRELPALMRKDPVLAKAKLAKHLDAIRMLPQPDGSYVAEGDWDLTGIGGPVMVAGARFELATFGL